MMRHLNFAALLLVLTATVVLPANAVSIRSLLGLDDEEEKTEEVAKGDNAVKATPSAQSTSTNWGKTSGPTPVGTVDLALVKRLMANLDKGRGQALLADEQAFAQFIQQEAGNLSVLAAARSNNLQQDENTAFLMQRGADNILREIYLNKLITEKLPKDFPSDEQVQEYYDKNQQNFVVAERIHVWQIFFPVSAEMDEKAVTELRNKANTVADDIRNNKTTFNSAAVKHSKHAPSNANGGYMGLIKTADLKPDIKKTVLELGEGKISRALTTDTGIHIVKRGAIVPERKISLDESRNQVKNLLVKQVRAQLRKAIFEQAAKTYPVELSDNKIEEWRLRLRTNLEAPAGK